MRTSPSVWRPSRRKKFPGMRAAAAARPLALDVALFPVFHPEQPGSGVAGVGYTREYENGVRVAEGLRRRCICSLWQVL